MGELGRGGGLAGAIDADHQDHLRLGGEWPQGRVVEGENLGDLSPGDFDDVIGGDLLAQLKRLQDFHRHRNAEISPDERLLKLIPIHRLAGELFDNRFEKSERHGAAITILDRVQAG